MNENLPGNENLPSARSKRKRLRPHSFQRTFPPCMFWKKITIRVINVIFRYLSWIQTFWNAIQHLEVSLHELISFIQSMFDITSNKHRNQYVSLFNFHFISKMPCTRENVGRYNITEAYNVQLDYCNDNELEFSKYLRKLWIHSLVIKNSWSFASKFPNFHWLIQNHWFALGSLEPVTSQRAEKKTLYSHIIKRNNIELRYFSLI